MLSYIVDAVGSPIANLCYFAVQSYEIFLRLSSLDFSVRIDMVLFTKLYKGFL